MKILRSAIWVALGVSLALRALAQSVPTPAHQHLREIYKELVEINTTDTPAGNVTNAADAVAARLKAAGFPASDIQVHHWAKDMQIQPHELRTAVGLVGPRLSDIRQYFGKSAQVIPLTSSRGITQVRQTTWSAFPSFRGTNEDGSPPT